MFIPDPAFSLFRIWICNTAVFFWSFFSLPFLHCWAIYPLSFHSVELANHPPLSTPFPSPASFPNFYISSVWFTLSFPFFSSSVKQDVSQVAHRPFFFFFSTPSISSHDEQCRGMETGGSCSPAPRPSVPGCPRRPCDSQRTGRITHKLIQHSIMFRYLKFISYDNWVFVLCLGCLFPHWRGGADPGAAACVQQGRGSLGRDAAQVHRGRGPHRSVGLTRIPTPSCLYLINIGSERLV